MTQQELTLSLTVTIVLLIGTGFYAIWLRLELWVTKRSLSHIAVIQAQTPPNEPPAKGCAGFLIGLTFIAAVISIMIIAR